MTPTEPSTLELYRLVTRVESKVDSMAAKVEKIDDTVIRHDTTLSLAQSTKSSTSMWWMSILAALTGAGSSAIITALLHR